MKKTHQLLARIGIENIEIFIDNSKCSVKKILSLRHEQLRSGEDTPQLQQMAQRGQYAHAGAKGNRARNRPGNKNV